jgi:hypothetical protein
LIGGRIIVLSMTNSGKDASVICENLNTVLREFNIPVLKRIKTPKKGGGRWKDKLTTMERLEADAVRSHARCVYRPPGMNWTSNGTCQIEIIKDKS